MLIIPAMTTHPPQQPKSNTGKIVGCVGCGCVTLILVFVAVVAFIFMGVSKVIKSSEPYVDSIAAVSSNPAATEALGSPITPGFLFSGSMSTTNGVANIDATIPVSGPNGKGNIRIVGTKPSDSAPWEYSTWQLDVEGGESIPLGQ